jgi:hypothetical protein
VTATEAGRPVIGVIEAVFGPHACVDAATCLGKAV